MPRIRADGSPRFAFAGRVGWLCDFGQVQPAPFSGFDRQFRCSLKYAAAEIRRRIVRRQG